MSGKNKKFILNLKNVVMQSWNDYVNENYKRKTVSFSHKYKQRRFAMSVLARVIILRTLLSSGRIATVRGRRAFPLKEFVTPTQTETCPTVSVVV